MIIGITGPIGSGKNEVCGFLKEQGAVIIDVDVIGHEIVQQKWADIVKAFSSKVLRPGGKIDRKKLGKLVFSDPVKLKKLNEIVHPGMKDRIVEACHGMPREPRHGVAVPFIIINAALLKEIGLIELCDEVWVVVASCENRMKWLSKRPLLKDIMKSQMSQAEYLDIADRIIRNNGSKRDLKKEIENERNRIKM
ncbi:MAG: dephospho-CoA kinase [Candidatus Saganbacteria bacterium]|nr:dephospho-CoA kinase [Candidatus Saganbacteria bacterium]